MSSTRAARVLFYALAGALLGAALAGPASGQQVARLDVPRRGGGVTGLETGIEGSLHARPGGRLRWFVTVHEIIAGRDLRPAPRAALRVLASFQPGKPLLEAVSDTGGRAELSFDIPADLERAFQLVIEVRSPARVQRRFEVTVKLGRRYRTELHVDRRSIRPGGQLQAWGRVIDLARGRPSPGHALTIQARDSTGLIRRVQATKTDQRGVFHVALQAPGLPQTTFSVEASATNADPVKVAGLVASVAHRPALVVVAQPQRTVVPPGALVQVEVVVRTPQGRPVPRATLTGLSIPRAKKGKRLVVKPTLTDARGRARVPWRVVSTAALADVTGQLQAVREGLGTGSATVRVRATRRTHLLAWAVEGGALVPGLPGRLFLRAFHPDGRPLSGAAVRLDAGQPTAGRATTTDAEGVAIMDVNIGTPNPSADCSGLTTSAATVHVGPGTEELCLPIDPEATIRVRPRSPTTAAGQPVEIAIERRPTVAASPVAVTLLARAAGGVSWQPVAQAVAPPRARRISLRPPPDAVGLLWVRARPLVGPARQEVRGGSALIWSSPGPALALRVAPSLPGERSGARNTRPRGGRLALDLQGTGTDEASGFAMALTVDEGERLLGELRRTHGQPPEPGGGPARLAGFLAAHTPVDDAAAGVLHQGKVLPVAMPARPAELGLLRDPWRSRARFVRGRLGRLLHAVEDHVAAHIPDQLRQVAIRGPGGWRFNREMLRGITDKLGAESMSGLDGSPLTIEALHRLAPAFVYDNVARRLTRQRLLNLLVLLRAFVRQQRLDHAWPRRGEPASWLSGLVDWQDPDGEMEVERAQLFDAWGRPFLLRRAPGGRARFRYIEPVVGYELISAGPDGRAGTGDDVHDPFGRVLGRGGVYAEAVGEETLLARLRGVELGRATINALAEVFKVEAPADQQAPAAGSTRQWDAPSRVPPPLTGDDLAFHQAGDPWPGASVFQALGRQGVGVTLALSPEPRRYLVVAGAYGRSGVATFAARPLRAGAALLLDAQLPQRLRQGERLVLPVRLTNLRDGQRLSLQVSSKGPIEAEVSGPAGPAAVAGRTRIVLLRLSAPPSRVGTARLRLRVLDSNGTILREIERSVLVMGNGSLRAQHTGAIVQGQATLSLQLPPDARQARAVLVVSGPRDLLGDPGLRDLRRAHPALLGWAHALRGRPAPASLLDALAARPIGGATTGALENACAAVAWSAARVDREAHPELGRALARVRSALPSSLRLRSALLVALAAGAPGLALSGKEAVDPVAALVSELREEAWNAVETERGRPAVMARLAAGLLLLDRRDAAGRQFFRAARAALVSGRHGGQVLGGAVGRDAWIGTVALAIAARQLGEHALAFKLAAGIAPRLYLGMGNVEAAFWLLAASVYGAFGSAGPAAVEVQTDGGRPRRLPLHDGVGSLELAGGASRIIVRSHDGRPVLARLEARYLRPVVSSTAAPLSARIDGYVGHVGETAALEITVESRSASATRPVLELLLPSAAELDQEALRSMTRAPAVLRVDPPDLQGLLRIHLRQLGPRQQHRLPLPARWIGGGTVRGLSLAVYDAERPWHISSVPARTIHLAPLPEEVW